MFHPRLVAALLAVALLALVAPVAVAQDAGEHDPADIEKAFPKKAPYSPYAGRNFPTRPFFGDTHLHTSFSMDAGAFGARLGPPDAFRFAKGAEVTSNSGQPVKLSRPLDFLVVADHSDGFGFFPLIFGGDPTVMADPQGRKWNEMIHSGQGADAALDIIRNFGTGTISKAIMPVPGTAPYRGAWQKAVKAAEEANEPGRFTAFIGFEWTSNTGGNNLHRNVVFRDDATKALQVEPYTTMKPLGSDNPADLWKWMAAFEQKTGGDVLAIAHNGNLSNGEMFPMVEAFGKRIDRAYADERAKWERLYEVTQTKGTGEAHPFLSPNDEFADYELWDKGNLDGSVAKKQEMLQYEYARRALQNGLILEQKLGVNPYKFGMIGSTDAHTGLVAVEEESFFGKTAPQEPSPERLTKTFVAEPKTGVKIMDWEVGASGYAAVWATENTREALFDAMERRETYATTGTRMVVRFFGGWDFVPKDAHDRMPARIGYGKGVPMGGDLAKAPAGKAPTFLVAALKDPIGANLDRIQVVKGWVDAKGEVQEKVYDVAWSGDRKPDPKTGKVPSVGSTVDVENATWTNSIGAPELIAVWKDPAFDPALRAFYYLRVLEIPTPRWTAYDAKRFGNKPLPGTRMTITERAYTSPIWYSPN
ncbi:MAG: DUF3604 domain-containing protein [Thermoanaerobaculia bacterium]|nr:DUF3604 domain-containing protein [Thermoanaerobaculia bacterium]